MQQIVKVRRVANPRRKKRNPTRVITMGAKNPRRKKMATRRRRRSNPTPAARRARRRAGGVIRRTTRRTTRRVLRRAARRASNPTRVVVRRRRRAMARRRRSNPTIFGRSMNTTQAFQAVLGGLVGVAATKIIPSNLPATMLQGNIMRIFVSGITAFLSGWVAGRISQPFGDAVTFGGLMQTGSIALNAFVPSIGSQIGLNGLRGGLGELVAGSYPVPQNPLGPPNYGYGRMLAPAEGVYGDNAPVTMSGLRRSFGRAF